MSLARNHTQKRIRLAVILAVALSAQLCGAPSAPYQPTPSFDKRRDGLVAAPLSIERQQSVAALETRIPGVRVDWDPIAASPVWIGTLGLLSGPTKAEIERAGDFGLSIDDPHRAIKAFILENAPMLGHGLDVLSNATIVREYVTAHNGLRTVEWEQRLDGIAVFEATFKGHITKRGELVNISSRLLPEVEAAVGMGQDQRLKLEAAPPISAAQAVAIALTDVGQTIEGLKPAGDPLPEPGRKQIFASPALVGDGYAKLMWLPLNRTTLRLCWSVTFVTHSPTESFWTLVDAVSGEVPVRHNVTAASGPTPATYRIYPSDSPAPMTPGLSTPASTQAAEVSSQLVTLSYLSAAGSPLGWIPSGANSTEGPNVRACLNRQGTPNDASLSPTVGSSFRVFDYTANLANDPSLYTEAAVVNLFYWCNWMHDKLYDLGFNEAAGSYQGITRIWAHAQYRGTNYYNNARFVPASGSANAMIQMGLFGGAEPKRDADLATELILHEYTHAMSFRLAGVDGRITAKQSLGLSEGWSDFYALALLSEPADDTNGCYPFEGYTGYLPAGYSPSYPTPFTQNYYFGWRRYPYTPDMAKNPVTFEDINPNQSDHCSSGAPFSGLYLDLYGPCDGEALPADEPHNVGEFWCVTLWEARRNLIMGVGYNEGNQRMLQIVTDGMKLCPDNPNFTQARDALFQADYVDYCAVDQGYLAQAFSKRGMGYGSVAGDSSTTTNVVESFAVLPISAPCQQEQ